MDYSLWDTDPRSMVLADAEETGFSGAYHLLLCCMKSMTPDEVREMLDANEMSPRFEGDDDE